MDKKIIYANSLIIAILAIIATTSGLFWNSLYKHDTISIIAQMMGQDLITLTIAVPLILISLYLIYNNSLRGRLIWMGILFYFIYTYASMSFLASYNQLFLVYVAIFSLSLYTFLGELVSLNVSIIKKSFKPGVIIQVTAAFLIVVGLLLSAMWLKMIIDSLLTGTAPAALGSYTTLVIQAMDLGIVVPAAILSGILLLKNKEWGYTIASIFLIKASLLGTAIISMILFMIMNGVTVSEDQMIFFIIITIFGIGIAISFYQKIKGKVTW
ncbi:MAG: hypothetical protein ACLPWD_06100 [Methanobacterium sp.]